MYRFAHFRGAAIMGALSAIDIALWDIAGKHFDVPAYQLMGGAVRDKARVYYHVLGDTREKLVEGVKAAREDGFTAVGHLTPFLDEDRSIPYFKSHVDKMEDAIDAVRQYREAAGDNVDILHRDPPATHPGGGHRAGEGHRAVPPDVLRGPDPAGQPRRHGADREQDFDTDCHRRAHSQHPRVPDAAPAQRRAVRPAGRVHGGRAHALQEDRGAGRGAVRWGHSAQPTRAGEHRGVPAACGVYSQLRYPGIPAGRA